jgi:hypothetical protein
MLSIAPLLFVYEQNLFVIFKGENNEIRKENSTLFSSSGIERSC